MFEAAFMAVLGVAAAIAVMGIIAAVLEQLFE